MKREDVSVLIVDDSDHIRALFLMTMKKAGIQKCIAAKNGEEGVRLYKEHHPSIVFLDNMLPILSGMEVLQQIKSYDPKSIVVMISAASDVETIRAAKAAGANYYIIKPYLPSKVIDVINTLLSIEGTPI